MTNLTPDPISPEHAELVDRLNALGQAPVDSAVASAHLTKMAAAPTGKTLRPVRERFVRAKVAAAFAAGLMLGGTSLASAGALGTTPQNAVADAAGHVGLDLPGGTPRSTEGCGGETYRNHGQFVSRGGDPHSPCGKPVKSTDKQGRADHAKPDHTKKAPQATAGDGCGKPPWAGKDNQAKKTPAAVAQRKAACGDDDSDTAEKEPKAGAATTTTVRVTTTTVGVTTTTVAVTTTTAGATTTTAPSTTTTTTTTAP
jgi:hypothetical protein